MKFLSVFEFVDEKEVLQAIDNMCATFGPQNTSMDNMVHFITLKVFYCEENMLMVKLFCCRRTSQSVIKARFAFLSSQRKANVGSKLFANWFFFLFLQHPSRKAQVVLGSKTTYFWGASNQYDLSLWLFS